MINWINQDILFWTFSTIAQTFGAILALIGALSIFKMQLLQNDFKNLISKFREKGECFRITPHFSLLTDYEFYEKLKDYYINEKYEQKPKINGKHEMVIALKIPFKSLQKLMDYSIPNLKGKIIRFSIINISLIFLSLIGLIIVNPLSKNFSGWIFLTFIAFLCFISLVSSVRIIKYCLSI